MNDENANHIVLEGCISLYSAITELTRKEYPELANTFFEMANTLYPYGLLSYSKVNNISLEQAENFFEMPNKKPIVPSDKELKENPPSRSAKLRYLIKKKDIYEIKTDILEKFSHLIEIENLSSKLWKRL